MAPAAPWFLLVQFQEDINDFSSRSSSKVLGLC